LPTLHHVREISLSGSGLVVAADSVFMGIPFREVSISRDSHLLQAWNSVRFFAWSERTFFRTPYAHGDVRVTPRSFEVKGALRAEMIGEREPSFVGQEDETYKVLLPRGGYFIARLSGLTKRYPVLASDVIEIPDFTATEWIVRADATHGKSRTYRG
jgi:hypothetical protein